MESATQERPLKSVEEEDDGLGAVGAGAEPPAGDEAEAAAAAAAGVEPPESSTEPPTPPAALPDDDPDAEEAPEFELTIGGNRQLGLKVGGRMPDSCVMKLKGGKIELAGQFDRGDRLMTVATLQVVGDNDQDTIDKLSGEVKSTSKAQSATLCGILRLEEFLEQRLPESLVKPVFEALDLELPEAE